MKKWFCAALLPLASAVTAEQVPEALYRQILADQYPTADDRAAFDGFAFEGLPIRFFNYRFQDVNCDGARDYVLDDAPGFCGMTGNCSPIYYRKDGEKFSEIREIPSDCPAKN